MRVPSGTRGVVPDAVRMSERALKLARALNDDLVFGRDSVLWFEVCVEKGNWENRRDGTAGPT